MKKRERITHTYQDRAHSSFWQFCSLLQHCYRPSSKHRPVDEDHKGLCYCLRLKGYVTVLSFYVQYNYIKSCTQTHTTCPFKMCIHTDTNLKNTNTKLTKKDLNTHKTNKLTCTHSFWNIQPKTQTHSTHKHTHILTHILTHSYTRPQTKYTHTHSHTHTHT